MQAYEAAAAVAVPGDAPRDPAGTPEKLHNPRKLQQVNYVNWLTWTRDAPPRAPRVQVLHAHVHAPHVEVLHVPRVDVLHIYGKKIWSQRLLASLSDSLPLKMKI